MHHSIEDATECTGMTSITITSLVKRHQNQRKEKKRKATIIQTIVRKIINTALNLNLCVLKTQSKRLVQ